jgi:hypothetical protein
MIQFDDKVLMGLLNEGGGAYSGMRFNNCIFNNCRLALTTDSTLMPIVSNVELNNCSQIGCRIGPAILRDITVTNLNTGDLFIIWGAFFDRVILSGNVNSIKINRLVSVVDRSPVKQRAFDELRHKFYQSVEYALDIRTARFRTFDSTGIPARLIKRDPESQVVVTRNTALKFVTPGWEAQLDPTNKLWPFMVNSLISSGEEDMVLVAPLASAKKKRDELLRGLRELQALGVAEQD